jgi:hypothetical protein
LCAYYWEYELSLERVPEYTTFHVVIVVVVANHPSSGLLHNLK